MWEERIATVRRVRTFAELHDALSSLTAGFQGIGRVFRGHADVSWDLVPKAGRAPFKDADLGVYFSEWKRHALAYVALRPGNDWEWLAIAQHYGLATNLLDWTYNPMAAAFFAVAEAADCDAAIFSYRPDSLALTEVFQPLHVEGIAVYKPFHLAGRITRQMGVFTVHGPASLALDAVDGEAEKLQVTVVDRAYRQQLLVDLAGYGVNHGTLFPDLDGLSKHINWKMLNDVLPNSL
jgi:hypothetical protein